MKIAVMGGGFNPPHIGHVTICEQVLSFTNNKEVWLVPYFAHPWEKPSIDPSHRLKMCEFMTTDSVRVSDLEIRMKKKNYTFETVDMLVKKFPQHEFSWIIGTDLWPEFLSWEHADEIMKKMHILVFPRAGFAVTNLPQNVFLMKNKLLITSDVSSEKIREMVKDGLSIKGLVLPEVEEYIYKHKLYK